MSYVYYDVASKKIAAYRRTTETAADSGDWFPYEVEGPRGIEALVQVWEDFAGATGSEASWPQNDQELRLQQLEDPGLMDLIHACQTSNTDVERRGRKLYVPTRPDKSRGALRARREVADRAPTVRRPKALPSKIS